jgi:ADP-heptose:LPS heptosyltransferase
MAEKVLLVCTSTTSNVSRAVGVLRQKAFQSPQIDLLCRALELPDYEKNPNVRHVLVFPHRQEYWAALKLWGQILRERYNVVAVLWCLDPGRFKAKLFAFLCGGRRLLIFNENLDCEYLKPRYLMAIMSSRGRDGTLLPKTWKSLFRRLLEGGFLGFIRLLMFPFRILFLVLLVAELFFVRSIKSIFH